MLLEQVRRFVRQQPARHRRWSRDVHAIRALFDAEHRDLLLVVTLGPLSGKHAVLPGMPRADDVLVAHAAIAQGPAFVIAAISDGGKTAPVMKDGNAVTLELHAEWRACSKLVRRADEMPGLGDHATSCASSSGSRASRRIAPRCRRLRNDPPRNALPRSSR